MAQSTDVRTTNGPMHGTASSPTNSGQPSTVQANQKYTKATPQSVSPRGVTVARRYTAPGVDPLDSIVYERRSSSITNPDGSVVFKMDGAEVPASWSQLATDIVISKYFRKAGLYGDKDQGETSVRQVVYRIAHTIRQAADEYKGYFPTKADAD